MILEEKINDTNYITLRQFLKENLQISNRLLTKLKLNKLITVNSNFVYLDYKLNNGDIVTVNLNYIENSDNIIPIQMPLNIIYEDDAYIVINKSPYLPVHPSRAHYEDTLSNGVKYYFEKNGINKKIRPVNRLDMNTSRNRYFCKK